VIILASNTLTTCCGQAKLTAIDGMDDPGSDFDLHLGRGLL